MTTGGRALGVAESYRGTDDETTTSTLAGAVVGTDGTVDDFVFGTCTVGGLDATDAVVECWRLLDRPDVRCLFVAGVAPAWYNFLDLEAISEAIDRPVVAVSFEASDGLDAALADAFEGEELAIRRERYAALPPRRRVAIDGRERFVRSVGVDPAAADDLVESHSRRDRPEPLWVAKRAARRVDEFRRDERFRRD